MIFCRRYSGITEMDSRLEEKVRRRCCASDGLKEAALHLNCTVGWRRGKTSPALAAGSWDGPCHSPSSCHLFAGSLVSLKLPAVSENVGVRSQLAAQPRQGPQGRVVRFHRRNPIGFSKNEARCCMWCVFVYE